MTGPTVEATSGEVVATPHTHRLPGLCLLLAGLGFGVETMSYEVAFMTDPVGPRALPGLVSIVLALAGVHTMIRPPDDFSWVAREGLSRAGAAAATFLIYSVVLPIIGFFTATTLAVAVLSGLFGAPARKALPSAALLSGALWVVFVLALGLPLPIGSLWIL